MNKIPEGWRIVRKGDTLDTIVIETPDNMIGLAHCFDSNPGNILYFLARELLTEPNPIDMVLYCPRCHTQHIDQAEPLNAWLNPPHRSHLCHHCLAVWRPADVPTNGVASILTTGSRDNFK